MWGPMVDCFGVDSIVVVDRHGQGSNKKEREDTACPVSEHKARTDGKEGQAVL